MYQKTYSLKSGFSLAKGQTTFLEKLIYKKIFTLTNNEGTCQKNVKFDKVLVNVMKKIKNFLKQDLPNNVEASTQALKT